MDKEHEGRHSGRRTHETKKPQKPLQADKNTLVARKYSLGVGSGRGDLSGTRRALKPNIVDQDRSKLVYENYSQLTGEHGVFEPQHVADRNLDDALARYSPRGKKLRKAFERPRPDLAADAPANRTRKQIALTLPPDLIDEVTEAARLRGVDRNRLIEIAIRQMLRPA